jgi:anti-sigma regulatory factor (Ser/Thr protein kinase)
MLTERWVFRAVPAAVAEARHAARELADRLGADAEVRTSIALCVTEAVSNVVTHAYRHDREPGTVEVAARRPLGGVAVTVRDAGCGLAARHDSPGAGLGLGIIAQLASWMKVHRLSPQGTELLMRFDLRDRS